MANLIEAIQRECNRLREQVKLYESIGPAGRIGIVMMQYVIDGAERAIAGGDIVEMVRVYAELRESFLG